jgi:type II secretory ATPase GspE/PulE/Tfp pilus assembly ATPase PilB-like protein
VIAQRLLRRTTADLTYRGRVPAAEIAFMTPALRQATLAGADAAELAQLASREPGHQSLRESADALVAQGITDAAEVDRVLGARDAS